MFIGSQTDGQVSIGSKNLAQKTGNSEALVTEGIRTTPNLKHQNPKPCTLKSYTLTLTLEPSFARSGFAKDLAPRRSRICHFAQRPRFAEKGSGHGSLILDVMELNSPGFDNI